MSTDSARNLVNADRLGEPLGGSVPPLGVPKLSVSERRDIWVTRFRTLGIVILVYVLVVLGLIVVIEGAMPFEITLGLLVAAGTLLGLVKLLCGTYVSRHAERLPELIPPRIWNPEYSEFEGIKSCLQDEFRLRRGESPTPLDMYPAAFARLAQGRRP